MDLEKKLDFQKIIDAIAHKGDAHFRFEIPGKFSVSAVCQVCVRRAYFDILSPEKFDDSSYRNFLLGNILHELFQKNIRGVLGDDIIHIESEKASHYLLPLDKTNGKRVVISGRLDSVFYLKDEKFPIVVDYKTTKSLVYVKKEPSLQHVAQLNWYMGISLSEKGYLVYIDKTNLEIVQHLVVFDGVLFDNTIGNAVRIFSAVESGVAPVVDIAKIKKLGGCAYCKHFGKCMECEKDLETEELLK